MTSSDNKSSDALVGLESTPGGHSLGGRIVAGGEATRRALADFQQAPTNAGPLLEVLTNDLNRVLAGPLLFDAQRFGGVALRGETRQLLNQPPAEAGAARLNRLLLEDAYPQEISRSDLDELLRMLKAYRPFIEL